jgi:small subunit ribosomal protein S20
LSNHAQAEKRARQSLKRRVRNRNQKSAMRTALKKARAATAKGKAAEVKTATTEAISTVMKVCTRGAVHKNKAARLVSRLARAANKVSK